MGWRRKSDEELARDVYATIDEAALSELYQRHGAEFLYVLQRYHSHAPGEEPDPILMEILLEGFIVAACNQVAEQDSSFADAYRLEMRDELLARADLYVDALAIYDDPRYSAGLAVLTQATAEEKLIVTCIVREKSVPEKLLPEDGFLTAAQLGHLLGITPGNVAVKSSRMTTKMQEALEGPKEGSDV